MADGGSLVTTQPQRPSNVIFVGDSITEGQVATTAWNIWGAQAGYRLGIDNVVLSGVGGSGYLASANNRFVGYPDYTFRERINDVVTAVNGSPPDAVVIAGGVNDGNFTPDQVGAEALAYFQQLRAKAPNMLIVVLGPWSDYNLYNSAQYAERDAIFSAASQVPGTYTVDVSGWVTAQNRDQIFAGATYRPHPVDSGHAYYGQKAAEAIAKIISGL